MAAAHPLRILVIDDDAVMTELLSAILGTRGHDVATADSGEAALALLPSQTFDVVLTDLQLPGLRGHELATALRSALAKSQTRLLGMSGSPPSDRERSAFDAFLLKPFNAEQFAEAAAGSSATPPSQPPAAETGPSPLDEAIFARLSAQLPPAKLQELFQLTLSDARMRLKLIEQAQAANDLDTVRREAHAIKGGAGMVGASELHRLAAKAEKDATEGSTRDTPTPEDFYTACNLLESMLNTRFS
jgi:CheY-like chemotaxis protein/HPt (histidine-containing phosphotransfer) domain-containing protein